ncbi:MAG: hypothetical protein JXA37_14035 [Chloroflexia bacterium]|nr:hypothetical protein [Chloroflexia bacterium]
MNVPIQHCRQAAELALRLGRSAEAIALCRHVLDQQRWDLGTHLLLGQAHLEQEEHAEAARRFKLVQLVDPECAEAHSGLGIIALDRGEVDEGIRSLAQAFENAPESDEIREALQHALCNQAGRPVPPPAFTAACLGSFYLRRGLYQPAAEAYAAAQRDGPGRPDLLLAYATALWLCGLAEQSRHLYKPFLAQTPRPLTALLLAAADNLQHGELAAGRQLWGEARAWDPDNPRAQLLLEPYAQIAANWRAPQLDLPESSSLQELLDLSRQMRQQPPQQALGPAARELAAYAQAGRPRTAKTSAPSDPQLRHFQHALQQVHSSVFGSPEPVLAQPQPLTLNSAEREGLRPAEVVLLWEAGLRQRFGEQGLRDIQQSLQERARATKIHGVSSHLVYLDRPPYPDLPQPDPHSPPEIKDFLDQLDQRLQQEGADLHYLFLIGGDELLPFASLPNPSEDADEHVPSDNLYASRDPTYLIPERAVGRLPDGGAHKAGPLLEQLAASTAHLRGEQRGSSPLDWLEIFWPWLDLLSPWSKSTSKLEKRFGLSAQVWAEASQRIFVTLPGQDSLRLCPQECQERLDPGDLAHCPLLYFNLHGAADSANWYGQRDLAQSGEGPLMPIAFSPRLIQAGRVRGSVVYSEACYGAHILGKGTDDSIALRFLQEGALGFVGSTNVSYGVSRPPLTDADLLGLLFWRHLLAGQPLGEALLLAKIDFTREMYNRQGYLDGDDMKTLLQFVLYGDPLVGVQASVDKSSVQASAIEIPTPPVLCEKHSKQVALHQLSDDLVRRVRRSLAWLHQDRQVSHIEVSLQSGCSGNSCRGRCQEAKAIPWGPEALVFTSRREMPTEDGLFLPQWARVVVDTEGHIVKMAVTR